MNARDDLHSPDEFDPASPARCHCGAALAARCLERGCHGETCEDCTHCARCDRWAIADAVEAFVLWAGGFATCSCGHFGRGACGACGAPVGDDCCGFLDSGDERSGEWFHSYCTEA